MPDHETWRFINTFAPWLSALGTLAAVITSLWLANHDRRIRLSVRAALCRQMLQGGGPSHGDRLVTVTVTNIGRRTATVNVLGWRVGLPGLKILNLFGLKRREFHWHPPGADLPTKLTDGDSYTYPEALDAFAESALGNVGKRSLLPWPYLRFGTMQAIVHTTAGKTFYATISKELRQELASRARAKRDWK